MREFFLTGLIGRRAKSWKHFPLILNGLLQTCVGDVISIALITERITAALEPTGKTNQDPAVGTLRNGTVATRRADIAIAGYMLDLADDIH
jgi:hypothetical protein